MRNPIRFNSRLEAHPEHEHGGHIHHDTEDWIDGSIRSHALALLKEVDDPNWQMTGEAMHEAIEALAHLVLALIDHVDLPKE